MIKKSLRAYITCGQLVKFVLPPGKAVGLLFCQFFKQQIHRVLVFFIVLQHLHGVQHLQQSSEVLLLHRGFIVQIGNQGGEQKTLRFFPEWVPAWEDAEAQGRVKLFLDPGRTFGSGTHVTTKLCLAAIERLVQGGEKVADLGCGSGILAIAALKLGAESAFACDLEPDCPAVVAENLARNAVPAERCTVRCGDLLTDEALAAEMGGGYDLILANIVSDVILALAPRVRGLLAPGGHFLCSGIIDTRAEEVAKGLTAADLTIEESFQEDNWRAFLCR